MKHLLIVLLLTGCATTTQPELPEGAEASAPAIGSVAFWRWAGKAVITLINSTEIKVNIDTTQKEAP